jgi:hypothetical protein
MYMAEYTSKSNCILYINIWEKMKQNMFEFTSKEVRDTFTRMLLVLFPSFSLVKIKSNGDIVLRKRNILSRSVTISFLDSVLYYIPNELSIIRWGNYDLTAIYVNKVVEILRRGDRTITPKKVEMVVNYLGSELLHSKIPNIFKDINQILIPLEEGHMIYTKNEDKKVVREVLPVIEDVKIVTDNGYSFIKKFRLRANDTVHSIKLVAASLVLGLFLNYRILEASTNSDIIKGLINAKSFIISHQLFQWTTYCNSG